MKEEGENGRKTGDRGQGKKELTVSEKELERD